MPAACQLQIYISLNGSAWHSLVLICAFSWNLEVFFYHNEQNKTGNLGPNIANNIAKLGDAPRVPTFGPDTTPVDPNTLVRQP